GERIRRLRTERGWSQETLAYEVRRRHTSSPTAGAIGQFERGVTRPTAQTIAGLATALGVGPPDFPEYRLALARRALDEAALGVGVDLFGPVRSQEPEVARMRAELEAVDARRLDRLDRARDRYQAQFLRIDPERIFVARAEQDERRQKDERARRSAAAREQRA